MSVIQRPSVCTFDCPDTCSLSVTVEDGRISKVRGSEAAPFTAGVICNKVAHDMAAFVHGRSASCIRCAAPARRVRQFERISWDAALDEIHARTSAVIDRWGPQAVTPLNYAGPHGMLAGDSMSLAVLPQAGRDPAFSPLDVRRRAQRSLGRHLWRGARLPAGTRR